MYLVNGSADQTGRWRKSWVCGASPNCVEVALQTQAVVVRDSKDSAGPVLKFTVEEWAAFVAGVRNGQFDVVA
jgi:Domain of unknown function (DUF397)